MRFLWSREGSCPVVVGVSDSRTTRLLPSYRLLLFINGELVSPSFTFTYARLAITLNDARAISWGEKKQTLWTPDSKGDQHGILPVAFLDDGEFLAIRREVDGIKQAGSKAHGVCVTPIGYIASFEAWLRFLLFDISNILHLGSNAPGKENSLGGLDTLYRKRGATWSLLSNLSVKEYSSPGQAEERKRTVWETESRLVRSTQLV